MSALKKREQHHLNSEVDPNRLAWRWLSKV